MKYRLKQQVAFFFEALIFAARNFIRDDCLIISSSISFVFLLALIPFSALFLFILTLFKNIFMPTLFPQNMVTILIEDIVRLIPFVPKQWIQVHLFESLGLGSFTTLNLVMLPIISGLLFKSLEEAFRRIFNLQRRSLLKGHVLYAAMSIFTILVFFMANFIWSLISEAIAPLQRLIDQTPYLHSLYKVVLDYFNFTQFSLVSLIILVLFFMITVKLFLTVPIKRGHRLTAGLLFALLWLMAREFFGLYVHHISHINVLFGSLSSVCIILLWIFYSSIALLYSVELMYVLHTGPVNSHGDQARGRTER